MEGEREGRDVLRGIRDDVCWLLEDGRGLRTIDRADGEGKGTAEVTPNDYVIQLNGLHW